MLIIPETSSLMTTTVFNKKFVKLRKKYQTLVVTKAVLNTKISQVENKIPDHAKDITIQEFNKLTTKNFAARLKQANTSSRQVISN